MKLRSISSISALAFTLLALTGCSAQENILTEPPVSVSADTETVETTDVSASETEDTEVTASSDNEPEVNIAFEPSESISSDETSVSLTPVGDTTTAPVSGSTSSTETASQTPAADTTASAPISTATIPLDGGDSQRLTPPAEVKGITNESFLKYTSICDEYRPDTSKALYLYNFNTSLSAGFGADGTLLPTEADYGIKGVLNGRRVSCTVYDHTGSFSLSAVYTQSLDASRSNAINKADAGDKFSVETSNLTNGLYRVIAQFSNGRKISLYFYVNGDETWLCQQEALASDVEQCYETRRSALARVIREGSITPGNSLSLENVWYPYRAFTESFRCDTQRWIDLSNTFIDDSWSAEYKLYAIQAWIRENIAYDDFVMQVHKSRANYYWDFTGKQSVYDLRAGVCFDYANIIAIMCRAHGIPAITVGSKKMNHEWNAVYINNRWMEVDACRSEQYHVEEDTSKRIKTTEDIYGGIYRIMIWDETQAMPSDSVANASFQQNSNYVY